MLMLDLSSAVECLLAVTQAQLPSILQTLLASSRGWSLVNQAGIVAVLAA